MATLIPTEEYQEIVKKLPIVCVDIVLLDDDDNVVLVRRNDEPEKGKQWFPGGRVILGESLEEAAMRHIARDVEPSIRYRGLRQIEATTTMFDTSAFGSHPYHTVNVVFCARLHKNCSMMKAAVTSHLSSDTNFYVRHYWQKAVELLK